MKKFDSWADFWKYFDDLCHQLETCGKKSIAEDLKFARLCVNGMTDGWYGFLEKLQEIDAANPGLQNTAEGIMLKEIIESLTYSLTNRN